MQVTDRRIYIAWEDATLRENIPLFEDAENAQDLPPPHITPALNIDYEMPPEECGYSFTKWVSLGALADTFLFVLWKSPEGWFTIPWAASTSL